MHSKLVTIAITAPTLYGAWQSPSAYAGFSPLARIKVVGFIDSIICADDGSKSHHDFSGGLPAGNSLN